MPKAQVSPSKDSKPVSTEQDHTFDVTMRVRMFGKRDKVKDELRSALARELGSRLPSLEVRSLRVAKERNAGA